MQTLHFIETIDTPYVNLDVDGHMTFVGKSYPEDIHKFYDKIYDWLNAYFTLTVNKITVFDFYFTYLNSVSSKALYDLFALCATYSGSHEITITWRYKKENELSKELGKELQHDFEMFEFLFIGQ